ncbi:MAG: energy coupling factor transporter S component ThiW [Thermoprotei archaeon]|nr:MAG: energy coupling factor transporter S component ThiW [Thermoprotei archaeon]
MRRQLSKLTLAAILTAMGVAIAPFLWFPFLTAKAYPGQHMINVLAGILLGPWWAMLVAFLIGMIRINLGIGTIYAIPGGIPGAFIVGVFYQILKKLKAKPEIAAFTEPLGTVFIGGTLSVYIVAPMIGHSQMIGALIPVWIVFGASSFSGSVLGFILIEVLKKIGILEFFEVEENSE